MSVGSKEDKAEEKIAVKNDIKVNLLISDAIIKLLQSRIVSEEYTSRCYLAMSIWLKHNGYCLAAALWYKNSMEELEHAKWAKDYLCNVNVMPITAALEQPDTEFDDLADIIAQSYAVEVKELKKINELADKALEEKDHAVYKLALHYSANQIKEIAKAQYWMTRLELNKDLNSLEKEMK